MFLLIFDRRFYYFIIDVDRWNRISWIHHTKRQNTNPGKENEEVQSQSKNTHPKKPMYTDRRDNKTTKPIAERLQQLLQNNRLGGSIQRPHGLDKKEIESHNPATMENDKETTQGDETKRIQRRNIRNKNEQMEKLSIAIGQ
ncbi:hypothetical protein DU53_12105 [Kosmotoga sp. DU53]|nr:hypothetical protein DU53_12105 [Kosmotoga sp. DU53]